jgi:hypothetical protein
VDKLRFGDDLLDSLPCLSVSQQTPFIFQNAEAQFPLHSRTFLSIATSTVSNISLIGLKRYAHAAFVDM